MHAHGMSDYGTNSRRLQFERGRLNLLSSRVAETCLREDLGTDVIGQIGLETIYDLALQQGEQAVVELTHAANEILRRQRKQIQLSVDVVHNAEVFINSQTKQTALVEVARAHLLISIAGQQPVKLRSLFVPAPYAGADWIARSLWQMKERFKEPQPGPRYQMLD